MCVGRHPAFFLNFVLGMSFTTVESSCEVYMHTGGSGYAFWGGSYRRYGVAGIGLALGFFFCLKFQGNFVWGSMSPVHTLE